MTVDAADIFPLMLIRTSGLPLRWPDWPDEALEIMEEKYVRVSQLLLETVTIAQTAFEAEKDRQIPDFLLQKITTNTRRLLRQGIGGKQIPVDAYLQEQRPDFALLLHQINEAINHKATLFSQIQEAWSGQVTTERQALVSFAENETLQRALLFSSHDLLEQLPAFIASNPENWHKKERQTASSLLKYLFRASTKTTPLSRMASVSLKDLRSVPAEANELDSFFSTNKHIVTPNVALLPAIYEVLLRDPAFFNTLCLQLNPGLQQLDGTYEWLFYNGEKESFQQMGTTRLLELLTGFFEKQDVHPRYCDLTDALTTLTDASAIEIQTFVFQLVDYGFLEWVFPENGLSPGWCGSLYNYLGFLPSSATLTDAAYLLQWLRTAARTISFQPIKEAIATQEETLRQCRHFFEKNHAVCPNISPEHIFYEDVAATAQDNLTPAAIQRTLDDLRRALEHAENVQDSGLHRDLMQFSAEVLETGASMPFLSFCKLFLGRATEAGSDPTLHRQVSTGKTGALLQFYKTDTNEVGAVLNALYPGGGKMMARWMHLFPSNAREQLSEWWPAEALAFPWQDWNNANFQPVFAREGMIVPGGRVGASSSKNSVLLKKLLVYRAKNGLQLREKTAMRQIVFIDNGLEDVTMKPPVIRILWELGVPFVSTSVFSNSLDWKVLHPGVHHRKRKGTPSLTLLRAAWLITDVARQNILADTTLPDVPYFLAVREKLTEWGIPRYFFAGPEGGKTLFFDQNSPVLIQELRKLCCNTSGNLFLSEMLPTPDQWIAESNGARHAAEWVLEFDF